MVTKRREKIIHEFLENIPTDEIDQEHFKHIENSYVYLVASAADHLETIFWTIANTIMGRR